jgi:hypothetical protein
MQAGKTVPRHEVAQLSGEVVTPAMERAYKGTRIMSTTVRQPRTAMAAKVGKGMQPSPSRVSSSGTKPRSSVT